MTDTHFAALFFLQLAVILFVCRIVGWIAARGGQPQVVAEMVAGFLMGPSFFGWIAPDLAAALFPSATLRTLFPTLFTMLVLMAIGTTLMAGPLFNLLHSRPFVARDPGPLAAEEAAS